MRSSKIFWHRAGEIAQWVRALGVKAEVPEFKSLAPI